MNLQKNKKINDWIHDKVNEYAHQILYFEQEVKKIMKDSFNVYKSWVYQKIAIIIHIMELQYLQIFL